MTVTYPEPVSLALPWPEHLLDAMGYEGRFAQLMLWWAPRRILKVFDGERPISSLDVVPWQLLESTLRFKRVLCEYNYTSSSRDDFPEQALLLDATRRQILAGDSDELRDYQGKHRQVYNALTPGDEQYRAIEFEFAIRVQRKDRAYRQLRAWLAQIA